MDEAFCLVVVVGVGGFGDGGNAGFVDDFHLAVGHVLVRPIQHLIHHFSLFIRIIHAVPSPLLFQLAESRLYIFRSFIKLLIVLLGAWVHTDSLFYGALFLPSPGAYLYLPFDHGRFLQYFASLVVLHGEGKVEGFLDI